MRQAFNTLQLTEGSRGVLKGEVPVMLRESVSSPAERKPRRKASSRRALARCGMHSIPSQARFAALKAWRGRGRARAQPASLRDLP